MNKHGKDTSIEILYLQQTLTKESSVTRSILSDNAMSIESDYTTSRHLLEILTVARSSAQQI